MTETPSVSTTNETALDTTSTTTYNNIAPSIDTAIVTVSVIRIDDDAWQQHIQDIGCSKNSLVKPIYQQNKIPAYGPLDAPLYAFV